MVGRDPSAAERRLILLEASGSHRQVMLFHISETGEIRRFEPRHSEHTPHPVVWAIDDAHLRNYLLPRDCPRLTYFATEATTADDIQKFLGQATAAVVVETCWLERIRGATLYRYRFDDAGFDCTDAGAGYFTCRHVVVPKVVDEVRDLPQAIREAGAEFLSMDDLWPLHDAVAQSTLQFSMIRMRNALPRRTS